MPTGQQNPWDNRRPIPFVGPSYDNRSTNVNTQKCINWYPEVNPEGSLSKMSLIPTPGLEEWVDLGTNAIIRGLWTDGTLLHAVSGSDYFTVTAGGTATDRGDLDTSTGLVSMASSPTEIMTVDGTSGYIYNIAADTLTKITDGDFPTSDTVSFLDGYFIVNKQDTGRFHISSLNAGTAWGATDFATAEGDPDNLVAVKVSNRRLWLFGKDTIEIWRNTGASAFPIERIEGSFIEVGLGSKDALAKGDNDLFWLGNNKYGKDVIFRAFSHEAQIISTRAVEWQLSQYGTTSDATCFVYRQEGHTFAEFTFPSANKTWVYDAASSKSYGKPMWHERSSRYDINDLLSDGRHRITSHVFFNGDHIVGDFDNGKLYKLKTDVFTEDGEEIKRTRRSPFIHESQRKIFFGDVQVMFEPGVGLTSGQGSDPVASLRHSNDGGNTWSRRRNRSIGKKGEYKDRVRWNRNGSGRNRVFELEISDPVNAIVIDAFAKINIGTS